MLPVPATYIPWKSMSKTRKIRGESPEFDGPLERPRVQGSSHQSQVVRHLGFLNGDMWNHVSNNFFWGHSERCASWPLNKLRFTYISIGMYQTWDVKHLSCWGNHTCNDPSNHVKVPQAVDLCLWAFFQNPIEIWSWIERRYLWEIQTPTSYQTHLAMPSNVM